MEQIQFSAEEEKTNTIVPEVAEASGTTPQP